MAHMLTERKDGKVEMMYTGQLPWHRLGQKLDNPATAEEAILAAHMDWEVDIIPAGGKVNGSWSELKNRKAIMRHDTKEIFGIVSDRYKAVQNREAFSFFDQVVGEGQAIYHTAGSLQGGRRIWILAKLPGELRVKNTDDITEKFLLLTSSHDGTDPILMFWTPTRVVCHNTLSMAMNSRRTQKSFSIRHTTNALTRISEAADALGIVTQQFDEFQELIDVLADIQLNSEAAKKFIENVTMTESEKESGEASKQTQKVRTKVLDLFENDPTNNLTGIKGSAWAMFNATTQFASHFKIARGGEEGRFRSNFFGSAAEMKLKALDAAKELAQFS